MRLPIPEALALIGGPIVNGLPRLMSDVNGPVRQPGKALGQTGPITEIPIGLPGIEELGSSNGLVLVALAGAGPTTPGEKQRGRGENTGNEERRDRPREVHAQSIARASVRAVFDR